MNRWRKNFLSNTNFKTISFHIYFLNLVDYLFKFFRCFFVYLSTCWKVNRNILLNLVALKVVNNWLEFCKVKLRINLRICKVFQEQNVDNLSKLLATQKLEDFYYLPIVQSFQNVSGGFTQCISPVKLPNWWISLWWISPISSWKSLSISFLDRKSNSEQNLTW